MLTNDSAGQPYVPGVTPVYTVAPGRESLFPPDVWANGEYRTVAEIIHAIREVIATYGWIQHEAGDPARGFCILGATWYVRDRAVVLPLGARRVVILDSLDTYLGMATDIWNDRPDRTLDDVLAALDAFERFVAARENGVA